MATPEQQRDLYLAEDAINAPAVTAYLTKYPERAVGETITDTLYGFDWLIKAVWANRGNVVVQGAYIDVDEGETQKWSTLSNILLEKALYPYADSFTTTATDTYTLTDAIGGEMMTVSIEGGPFLNPATDYTWDSETGELVLTTSFSAGQQVDYTYKKNPYS